MYPIFKLKIATLTKHAVQYSFLSLEQVIYGTGSLGLLLLMVLLIYGHVTVPKSHDSLKKFFIQQNKTAKLSELNKNVLESQLSAPLVSDRTLLMREF